MRGEMSFNPEEIMKQEAAKKAAEAMEAQRLAEEEKAKSTQTGENTLEVPTNEEIDEIFGEFENPEKTQSSE